MKFEEPDIIYYALYVDKKRDNDKFCMLHNILIVSEMTLRVQLHFRLIVIFSLVVVCVI